MSKVSNKFPLHIETLCFENENKRNFANTACVNYSESGEDQNKNVSSEFPGVHSRKWDFDKHHGRNQGNEETKGSPFTFLGFADSGREGGIPLLPLPGCATDRHTLQMAITWPKSKEMGNINFLPHFLFFLTM